MDEVEKLQQEIENLEKRKFLIDMIDTWSSEDYQTYDRVCEEIEARKKRIKELTNGG